MVVMPGMSRMQHIITCGQIQQQRMDPHRSVGRPVRRRRKRAAARTAPSEHLAFVRLAIRIAVGLAFVRDCVAPAGSTSDDVPAAMSHASGIALPLQSSLLPLAMSQASGWPFRLQSASHFVRHQIAVAILARFHHRCRRDPACRSRCSPRPAGTRLQSGRRCKSSLVPLPISQRSRTLFVLQSVSGWHSSGMLSLLQSWLVPAEMSWLSRMSLWLQSYPPPTM